MDRFADSDESDLHVYATLSFPNGTMVGITAQEMMRLLLSSHILLLELRCNYTVKPSKCKPKAINHKSLVFHTAPLKLTPFFSS